MYQNKFSNTLKCFENTFWVSIIVRNSCFDYKPEEYIFVNTGILIHCGSDRRALEFGCWVPV